MRRGALVLLGLVLLGLAAGAVFLSNLQFEDLREPLARRLSEALGHEVRVLGSLELEAWPIGLEAERVVVGPPLGTQLANLAEIGRIEIDVDLGQLLRRVLVVEALRLHEVDLLLEVDAEGRRNWEPGERPGAPAQNGSALEVRLGALRLEEAAVTVRDLADRREWRARIERARVDGLDRERVDARVRGEVEGRPFEGELVLSRPVGAAGRLSLDVVLGGLGVEASGALDDLLAPAGVDVRIAAHIDDVRELPIERLLDIPGSMPATASARLVERDGRLALVDIDALIGRVPELWLRATGTVADVVAASGVALAIEIGSEELDLLPFYLGPEAPMLGEFRATGQVTDEAGDLDIGDLRATVGSAQDVGLELSGGIRDLLRGGRPDLSWKITAPDLAALGALVDRELPALGPVVASGSLNGQGGSLGLNALDVSVGQRDDVWGRAAGRVANVLDFRGVHLDLEWDVSDLRRLGPLVAELPLDPADIGPVEGSALLQDDDGVFGLERFALRGGHPPLHFEIDGTIDDLPEIDEIDIHANLVATDRSRLWRLLDVDLPGVGPLAFEGRLVGSDERATATDAILLLGQSEFHGDLAVSFPPGERPRVDGWVQASQVRLSDLGISPDQTGGNVGSTRRGIGLEWSALRRFDGRLTLRAGRVVGLYGLHWEDLVVSVSLDHGKLHLDELQALLTDGRISAEARVEAGAPGVPARLRLDTDQLDLGLLLSQFTDDPFLTGALFVDAQLSTRLDRPEGAAAHLDGSLDLLVEGGRGDSRFARDFARDLTRSLTSEEWREETQAIRCLVASFAISRGQATAREVLLGTEDLTVAGGGTIDLVRREVDIDLEPTLRNPGVLSLAAHVRVHGPLLDPEFTSSTRSVVVSAVRHFFASTFRSVRRPMGLFGWRGRASPQGPCAPILEELER